MVQVAASTYKVNQGWYLVATKKHATSKHILMVCDGMCILHFYRELAPLMTHFSGIL